MVEEFRYDVNVRAIETFINVLRYEAGISLPGTLKDNNLTFMSKGRLNMKSFKDRGFVRSYRIIKITVHEEVVEEG